VEIVTAIAQVISAVAETLSLFIAWYMLRELGDIDGDRTDWWEKMPFRKKRKNETLDKQVEE
jgi:hypothetical protein